ncbi:restriction endonuclease subunit S [Anaerovibrio lipolyticus]|uniref:restriction endonuclease subunit S n=1 Tax=Anaerovibrio lipolyticus TaxID=82374 RepID=UPI0026EAE28B|nr:restriction endonuclease subunit S [Anaerovibrio lipolyticus]MBE6105258.1 restriction endonuclease subunit S [Anaerovibrio lipolyticus]
MEYFFEDVLEIINGKNQKVVENPNGKYPIYGSGGIMGYADDYICNADTIIIGRKGSINNPIYVSEPFWNVDTAFGLYANKELLNPRYLYYFCNNFDFERLNKTVTIPSLTKSDLLKIKIDVPELYVQENVVHVLTRIESIINLHQKELEYFDTLIKARFVEMFGTLHDNEKSFKVVTVDDVCTLIKDGTHQTPQYTEDRQRGFKFLSSKDVMSQKIDWTDIKYIPQELHEKLYATIKPQRNDILMSKNGVNYGVAAVNDTDEVFDIYVSLALLRPKNSIDPVFLRCAINSPETKTQFDSSIKGIGVPNLHLGEIKKTKIFLPPMEIQKEFVLFVEQVDKSKVVVQKALDETQTLFDSLMQEYFG